ncbi:MAG: Gfo/Idh/MocA family oxidoreductase [Bacteroidales bacterium]|nr:Gfo/Idh/MocA family oxidoreductase [Bacteroidales bacterium]
MNYIRGEIKWGIIGVGNVCEVKSGPAFQRVEDSKLIAVMRRNLEKAKDYSIRHNVLRYYSDADQLINDPDINAIYIATPPLYHEEYALKAMISGKPVYIEKPVTINANGCERLITASIKYKIPVSVAHYRRSLPLFKKIKGLLDEEILGRIRLILISMLQSPSKNIIADTEDNWRIKPEISGGGLFHDLAPHQLDLIFWYFGGPLKIKGSSINQGKKYNAPDIVKLEALFEDNMVLNGFWSFNAPEQAAEDSCTIIGERGQMKFSFFRDPVLTIDVDAAKEQFKFDIPKHIQEPHIARVVNFFKGNGENPCSLDDALESMKMIDSVRNSDL